MSIETRRLTFSEQELIVAALDFCRHDRIAVPEAPRADAGPELPNRRPDGSRPGRAVGRTAGLGAGRILQALRDPRAEPYGKAPPVRGRHARDAVQNRAQVAARNRRIPLTVLYFRTAEDE